MMYVDTRQEWERLAEAMSERGDRMGEGEWHALQPLEVTCLIRKDAILDAILMREDAILIAGDARARAARHARATPPPLVVP